MVYLILGINFGFLGPKIIITKPMLCNIILKIIINFITYIKGFISMFIIYIGIIGSLSCFDFTNVKVSLIIKIINFIGIKNMAHLAMLVIFHVNVITIASRLSTQLEPGRIVRT
jgi:hypothetical protein